MPRDSNRTHIGPESKQNSKDRQWIIRAEGVGSRFEGF